MEISCSKNKLGRGAYAFVYKGFYQLPVAVKRVLMEDVELNPHEEDILRKLNHPNIIKLFHAESDKDFRYYALELCEASLDQLYLADGHADKYNGPVPTNQNILLQLAKGLKYIHGMNLIHRDLKPANVLIWVGSRQIETDGPVQVLMKWADFGLSRPVKDTGSFLMSDVKGSKQWFAPELLAIFYSSHNKSKRERAERGTVKSDVFAEGLTFGYVLLGGVHPHGNNNMEIDDNLPKNNPVNLENIPAKYERVSSEVIEGMLKTNPDERLAAKEVVKRLKHLIHSKEIMEMGPHVTQMAALGRHFQLGCLYDYRNDRIMTDCELCSGFQHVNVEYKSKWISSESNDKWELMDIDTHLQASVMAGLIKTYKGASYYLFDRTSPTQVTRTLVCRTISRTERLVLPNLLDTPALATHVVVGVQYGAEIYCVFAQDIKDKDAPHEIEDKLSEISTKMGHALEDNRDVIAFTKLLDKEEKLLIRSLKCRLYADLQAQPVRECFAFEAYEHCHKLIEKIKIADAAVPISITLCPIELMLGPTRRLGKEIQYRDVDGSLVARLCHIWNELEKVSTRAKTLCAISIKADRVSLRQFSEIVVKFQKNCKNRWKESIVKARQSEHGDGQVEKVVKFAEVHYKLLKLERWVNYKTSELEMVGKMNSIDGIGVLVNKSELKKELADCLDRKLSLVLTVPSLNQRTNEMLPVMKSYVDNLSFPINEGCDEKEDTDEEEDWRPWYLIGRKQKQVMDKIMEFTDYVKKNNHVKNKYRYFITFGEIGQKFGCKYSVYKSENMLKDNLERLPGSISLTRIAKVFVNENNGYSRLVKMSQPNLYLLNAKQRTTGLDFRWFDIGLPNGGQSSYRNHKTFILMGASGSGKSTLIDGMLNYILGVKWKDQFRFKLCIREDESLARNQALSQTSSVTAYTIHHHEGMTVPYSVTIIDTPGYGDTRGVAKDKEISQMIHRFLTQKETQIGEIHAAFFVAASGNSRLTVTQQYILDSVLSIFGKDVKENIRLLVTFADNTNPSIPSVVDACLAANFPVMSASARIMFSKFDNSVLFASNSASASNQEDIEDQLFWEMGQENFENFFKMLEKMESRDLKSTRNVIRFRQQLEKSQDEIESELEVYLNSIENNEECMGKFLEKMKQYDHKIETNKNFEIEKTILRPTKVDCKMGFKAYNCLQCTKTCTVFSLLSSKPKKDCVQCNCPESKHEIQNFELRLVKLKEKRTMLDMKMEYESNCASKMGTEQLIEKCVEDLKVTKWKMIHLLEQVEVNGRSVDSTASRSNSFSSADYLSLMKSRVVEQQALGYETRLKTLNELQQMLNTVEERKTRPNVPADGRPGEPKTNHDRPDDRPFYTAWVSDNGPVFSIYRPPK